MQKAIIIIRILVGWVFIAEGYLKFAVPEELGVGRLTCRGSVHLSPGAKVLASFTTESPQRTQRAQFCLCALCALCGDFSCGQLAFNSQHR